MTQQAELLNKLDKLPQEYFKEVISFVGYLQHRIQQEKPNNNAAIIPSHEWINPLLGLGKTMGSTLTLERFREIQQEDIALEIENDQRLWGKK